MTERTFNVDAGCIRNYKQSVEGNSGKWVARVRWSEPGNTRGKLIRDYFPFEAEFSYALPAKPLELGDVLEFAADTVIRRTVAGKVVAERARNREYWLVTGMNGFDGDTTRIIGHSVTTRDVMDGAGALKGWSAQAGPIPVPVPIPAATAQPRAKVDNLAAHLNESIGTLATLWGCAFGHQDISTPAQWNKAAESVATLANVIATEAERRGLAAIRLTPAKIPLRFEAMGGISLGGNTPPKAPPVPVAAPPAPPPAPKPIPVPAPAHTAPVKPCGLVSSYPPKGVTESDLALQARHEMDGAKEFAERMQRIKAAQASILPPADSVNRQEIDDARMRGRGLELD